MRVRNRLAKSIGQVWLILGLLAFMSVIPALATMPEETGIEIAPAYTVPQSMAATEATALPFIAAEDTDMLRRKMSTVSSYVQSYNRKLASQEVTPIAEAIVQYSERYGVDYRLLTSLIAIESAFRRDAVSSSGAIGMGQLKPATAKWLGVVNPYDPVDNIAGTARFLGWLVRKYNGNLEYALSAYYQGPGYVDRNGVSSVCLPYLKKVNNALGALL